MGPRHLLYARDAADVNRQGRRSAIIVPKKSNGVSVPASATVAVLCVVWGGAICFLPPGFEVLVGADVSTGICDMGAVKNIDVGDDVVENDVAVVDDDVVMVDGDEVVVLVDGDVVFVEDLDDVDALVEDDVVM